MNAINASTLRLALINYRQHVLQLAKQFPQTFSEQSSNVLAELDATLLSIEGNITTVNIQPATCNPNK